MSEETVKIKGIRQGLLLIFDSDADFGKIEENIKNKLSSGFFTRGTPVYIKPDSVKGNEGEILKKLFNRYGLICKIEDCEAKKSEQIKEESNLLPKAAEEAKNNFIPKSQVKADDHAQEMMVVNRTLRGGQEIRTKASVLVCGNVNPGAQIIAGGSIDVRGKCLGMVHAGAYGNRDAVIIADRLLPTQIRIANLVARAPDDGEETEQAERASIKDGQIVIEPIER